VKLVTICTSFYLAEAELTRSRLEAAGFHPFLTNEYTSSWLGGGCGSTATMIQVQLPEIEAADAKEFLDTPATPAE
jgi:hypothetical protein